MHQGFRSPASRAESLPSCCPLLQRDANSGQARGVLESALTFGVGMYLEKKKRPARGRFALRTAGCAPAYKLGAVNCTTAQGPVGAIQPDGTRFDLALLFSHPFAAALALAKR